MIKTLKELSDEDFKGTNKLYRWRITEKDVDKIMSYLSKFGKNPRVLDVGCGSGLMSYLLAEKGCEVIAIDSNKNKNWDTKKENPEEKKNPQFEENSIKYVSKSIKDIDAIYCSWMPQKRNWSGHFYETMAVPMVIHVIGETPNKNWDLDDNDYDKSRNRVVTGLSPNDTHVGKKAIDFKDFGSPYQISKYEDYCVLDAWRVVDSRTVGDSKPQKLSKVRIDIKKTLLDKFK